ncbi:polysaccharide biosynthesis tyrosine autokinase [Microbacterium oleivorans]|uniref:polysaccharide biosynthesis tyrosine autokinase n=1 Tax=Microbacterium oleivorans TaxID=273677 RepID=UPI000767A9B0|nr:polysaccharide biosynthesis tyrosine autokinase [Microbacterium oleivorans]
MAETAPWSGHWLLSALRKFWWGVAVCAVVGATAAFGLSALETPQYQSTSSLYFALNQGASASDLNQGSAYTQNQMLSIAQLATTSRVLEPVIEELGLDTTPRDLARSLDVSIPQDTVILRVTSTTTNADRAAALSNAVAAELADVVLQISPKGAEGAPTITAETIDKAVAPSSQSSPNKPRDALLGLLIGALLGIAAALIFSAADTRVRNEDILARVSGTPVLGVITRAPLLAHRAAGVAQEPMGRSAEEFRRLRSALTYANVGSRVSTLLVTSGSPGEGKSTVAVNLALTLADLNHRVLLIDADLRRPQVHVFFGIEDAVGLTSVLLKMHDFDTAKYPFRSSTLDVLPSGGTPPNPAEILASQAMADLLEESAARYDFVVVDAPPMLNVADASLLAPSVDGVLFVVDATKTRRPNAAKSIKLLEGAGARILGSILNRGRHDKKAGDYYGPVTPGRAAINPAPAATADAARD